jgi:hypothetical protein
MENLSFVSEYAYGEDADPVNLGDPLYCSKCGEPMSWKKWLNPKSVLLEKPKYGDFVYGTFDTFLVSENFKAKYQKSGFKGIEKFDMVQVKKVRLQRKSSIKKPPDYFHVEIKMTNTLVDYEKSKYIWDEPPKCDYCMIGKDL